MLKSVHDAKLVSYTVNEDENTILLETFHKGVSARDYKKIKFSDVLAYFFENHSIQLGTIIFDIREINADTILENNWNKFESGKKWGWPGDWADSKEKARAHFAKNYIKAYEIDSTCGLCGWVLAQDMEIF